MGFQGFRVGYRVQGRKGLSTKAYTDSCQRVPSEPPHSEQGLLKKRWLWDPRIHMCMCMCMFSRDYTGPVMESKGITLRNPQGGRVSRIGLSLRSPNEESLVIFVIYA